MGETEPCPTWLQAQGLTMETARAVVTELGIKSQGVFGACTESLTMRAELFSLAKQKLPFAMYAEFRHFVESRWESRDAPSGGLVLVAVLHSMLSAVSRELAACAQKLISLGSVLGSEGGCDGGLEDAAIRIVDVCSLHHQGKREINTRMKESQHSHSSSAKSNCETSTQTDEELSQCLDVDDQVHELVHPEVGLFADELNPVKDGVLPPPSEDPLCSIQVKEELHSAPHEELDVFTPPPAEGASEKASLFSCSTCAQLFLTENALQLHMERRHRRGFPYKCFVCGKTFIHACQIKSHMRTHTGERPYKCSLCGKGFSEKFGLKSHMRIHTGERPYKCTVCGKGFAQSSNVKTHMKVHRK
uniref:C2H2-type domain-containing protein n=1 Tax=Eptatretus burgeri TaxID=7764 RepID=A0A8C4NKA1_EPTBU